MEANEIKSDLWRKYYEEEKFKLESLLQNFMTTGEKTFEKIETNSKSRNSGKAEIIQALLKIRGKCKNNA
jgi:hypothetical protein